MKARYAIAVVGLAAMPIMGGAVAYASTLTKATVTPPASSITSQVAPAFGATAKDTTGGANVQQGPNLNVQVGSQTGLDSSFHSGSGGA
ncbi:MAG: hypothetical protein ACYDHP_13145 [Ferrimicrobium sp.]